MNDVKNSTRLNDDSNKDAQKILDHAGITVNGSKPYDIQVHNPDFFARVIKEGSLGLGESYMDGWWDVKELDQFFDKVISANLDTKIPKHEFLKLAVKMMLFNPQTKSKSKKVAEQHYDLGNELYTRMLDKNMQYTCGYWKNAKTLDQAQVDKLRLICEKLQLKKGMKVLELGSGFGGLARFMAKEYGCEVVSYNISKEQIKYAREWCKGLPVTFVEADYREAKGVYDRIVSIGLCEHVGYKNYRAFMELAHKCLKDNGLFLLHTIASNVSTFSTNAWTDKYIFPGGMLPSAKQLSTASEGLFVLEDWHNFGADYDKTLMGWEQNFVKNWKELQKINPNKYNERFYRMWRYYLLSCAGSFRARRIQLYQIVYSKNGVRGGYKSWR